MAVTIDPLVNKLILLLDEEANLLGGVHGEIKTITSELKSIMVVLKEADNRADFEGKDANDGVKVWVKELRSVALEIENAIDEYTHFMAHQQHSSERRFIRSAHKVSSSIVHYKQRHNLASKVKELKQTVQEISERRNKYDFKDSLSESSQSNRPYDPRRNAFFLKETDVTGFEGAKEELVGVLEGESLQRTVVSVVGMGGLGKTTLARQVYNHVNTHFDCHAWIDVSQSYDETKLLRSLLKELFESRKESVPAEVDVMNGRAMMDKLRGYLQGKSYLIIFDDVWDPIFWARVQNALPRDNSKAGKVVITTRDMEVANNCKTPSSSVHIHILQSLPMERAMELFCKNAFGELYPPVYLKELSEKVVEKCQGLPLAIVVIAGLLYTKNDDVEEWRTFLNRLSSKLESNNNLSSITKILSLSYYALPHHLKSCFLYFGIFPEDYSIRRRRLIRQWIAEGFVCPEKDNEVELIAEGYLVELINRSLVLVSKRDFDGKPKACRVHDLLRDMIIKKMEDLGFHKDLTRDGSSFERVTRRITIGHSYSNDAFNNNYNEVYHARSIFILDNEVAPNQQIPFVTNFKFLKLLDFDDCPSLECIPEDIGKLFHLRYLSVRGTRVAFLPKSIGSLVNLETLDLKNTLVNELPVEINKLGKLRHLIVYFFDKSVEWNINCVSGVKIKKGIGRLKSLQKLYFIDANVVEFDVFNEIIQLTNLKKLGIKRLKSEDGKSLCSCIQKMEHLESLDITSQSEDELIDLESMSSPPKSLQRLSLDGHLLKFPKWIAELRYLVRIRILCSKLEDDSSLKFLEKLPNLLELGMYQDAYHGEKLRFKKRSFPKLNKLSLYGLSRLNSMIIEEGAMPNIEKLAIGPCPQLKEVPTGIQHLSKLKSLEFRKMSPQFLLFKDFQTIQFVPQFYYGFDFNRKNLYINLKEVMEIQKFVKENGDIDWNSLSYEEIMMAVFKIK